MQSFKTITDETVFEFTEKRSKFIATIVHIESEKQATEFIGKMRNKYWDARHNVYAYTLSDNNIKRFSDDGEPHGTAGKPVLDVIDGAELRNVAIVVTRYFGGILLGTGGLVRAYSAAAQGAVSNADIKTMTNCRELEIICDYGMFDNLSNYLKNIPGGVISTDFTNEVITLVYIDNTVADDFILKLNDAFNGKIIINKKECNFYAI